MNRVIGLVERHRERAFYASAQTSQRQLAGEREHQRQAHAAISPGWIVGDAGANSGLRAATVRRPRSRVAETSQSLSSDPCSMAFAEAL